MRKTTSTTYRSCGDVRIRLGSKPVSITSSLSFPAGSEQLHLLPPITLKNSLIWEQTTESSLASFSDPPIYDHLQLLELDLLHLESYLEVIGFLFFGPETITVLRITFSARNRRMQFVTDATAYFSLYQSILSAFPIILKSNFS